MSEAPIRQIKPVVVPAQFFVLGPLVAGFLSIFPGVFVFILSQMLRDPWENLRSGPDFTLGLTAYCLCFVMCMGFLWTKHFKEPERTTYSIYPDRVEYDEGFFTRHRRTLVFAQVLDVELTEGVLQQGRGAGTVTLVTQQMVVNQQGQMFNRRIELKNVPQPREVYELIRSLVLKKREQ